MGRRKKKAVIPPKLLVLAAVLGGFWLILNAASQNAEGFGLLLFVIAIVGGGLFLFSQWPKRQAREKLSAAVNGHIEALVRRRAQLLHRDAYGNFQSARWNKEIESFINDTVFPSLTTRERTALIKKREDTVRYVSERVAQASAIYPHFRNSLKI